MMRWLRIIFFSGSTAMCLLTSSCITEDFSPLELVSIEAGGVDLLTSPDDVTINVPVLATFTTMIDPASVTASSVKMIREYDQSAVTLILIVAGNVLSIKPSANFLPGSSYTLTISSEVKSTGGKPFGSTTVTFRTIGAFLPEGQVAYWNFDDQTDDQVGTLDPIETGVVNIIYAAGRNDSSGHAAMFNGTTSLIQVNGGTSLLRPGFSLSLWVYVNSDAHVDGQGNQKGNFVFGIGNVHGLQLEIHPTYEWMRFSTGLLLEDASKVTNDFQFAANGLTRDNVPDNPDSLVASGIDNATIVNQNFGSQGIAQRLDKTWAHVVFTFKDSTKTRVIYINGEKMIEQDLALLDNPSVNSGLRPLSTVTSLAFVPDSAIPATYDDKITFGFWQSKESTYGGSAGQYFNPNANHFKGMLDDVRVFNRALTATEVSMLYTSEK